MDWQQLTSLFIVALAAVLLARSGWQRRKRAKVSPCGGDCGCASTQRLKEIKTHVQPRSVDR